MTIQSGNRIDAEDYNNMQSKVANVLGTGSGDKGYGQTVLSSPVTNNAITAAQMQNLKTDLNKIKFHQTNTATLAPTVLANTLIKASDWTVYNQEATDLENARFTLSSNSTQSTKVVNLQRAYTTWNGTQRHNVIVDFGSANAGRYFFNSGGEIILEPSHSNNTLDKGANWAALFASFVPVRVAHSTTTARAGTTTNIGWYDLTTNDQIIFTIASIGTYAGNNYTVKARCEVSNNSTGTARYLYLTIELSDIGANPALDLNVDGVTTNKVSNNRATGSYVEVAAPAITDNYVTPPATYSLTANPATSANEGVAITFTLTTSNLPSGTLVPYTISGTGITASDFTEARLTGNFTLDANGFSTVIHNTAIDQRTEGNETFTLTLDNNGASISYVIIDTSLSFPTITTAPVIQMLPDTEVEGTLSIVSNAVWNPSTSGFAQYALWQSSTNGTTFSDTAIFDLTYKTVSNDIGKYWRLRQASTNYETLAYSNVIGPVKLTQTYTLTASPEASATEDTSVTITLATFNVNDGSIPYTISGTGITAADFGLSSLKGSFNLVSSTASITLNLVADRNQSEISEDFTISLDNGRANLIYRINDPLSDYSFSGPIPIPGSVDEGSSITFEVTTVNVYLSTLYWDIDYNSATQAADFTASNGSFALSSNKGTFEVGPIIKDLIKEDTPIQSFRVRVRTGPSTATPPGPVVLTSSLISINDTSITVISTLTFEKSSYLIGQKAVLNWTIDGADYDTIRATILNPDNKTILSNNNNLAKNIRTFTSSSVFTGEGDHTGRVELFKGGTKMAQSEIKTSVGGAPTYSLTRSAATGKENSPFTFTLTTTNVEEGVLIPFTITRSTTIVSITDNFSKWVLNGNEITPSLTGNFVARSGGTNPDIATLVITPADDRRTESSNETVTLALNGPLSGSINYIITDPNLKATSFTIPSLTDQEPNTIVTSSTVTISGLESNLSTVVTATNGSVDAGTTTLSGTFAASQTVMSSSGGAIVVAARVTTGAVGQVAKSATITVNGLTNATFTATTRLGDVDGDLSNPNDVTDAALNTSYTTEAVFTNLEKGVNNIAVAAASGQVSSNATTGFGTSCTLTTDGTGQASIWYKLTSSTAVSTTVSMGILTVKNSGGSKTYEPNWSVTTKAVSISGKLNDPADKVGQKVSTTITSAAVTIENLQKNFAFSLSIADGKISSSTSGTFSSTINKITSNSSGTITFYYQVTTPNTYSTTISVGKLTLTGGSASEIYTPTWSVSTIDGKINGVLKDPVDKVNQKVNSAITSAVVSIEDLEKSFPFSLSIADGKISSSATGTFSSTINKITSTTSGTITFYYQVTTPNEYEKKITIGELTLTGGGKSITYNPTWSVTTNAFRINGTIATNYSGGDFWNRNDTNSLFPKALIIQGLEPDIEFTVTVDGHPSAKICGSFGDPYEKVIKVKSGTGVNSGGISFYMMLTSSDQYKTKVEFGSVILSYLNYTSTYKLNYFMTTRQMGIGFYRTPSPTNIVVFPGTVVTSNGAEINGLASDHRYTFTVENGLISFFPTTGFAKSITMPKAARATMIYHQLTAPTTGNFSAALLGSITPGIIKYSSPDTAGGAQIDQYDFRAWQTKEWVVSAINPDVGGELKFEPPSINNATRSTVYKIRVYYTGLQPNYTFTVSNTDSMSMGPTIEGPFSSTYTFIADEYGSHFFFGSITSSSAFGGVLSAGAWLLTDPITQQKWTNTTNWTIATSAATVSGTISSPANITNAIRDQEYVAEVNLTGFDRNIPITISHTGVSANLGTSSSSFNYSSININTDPAGAATIWYRLKASSNYSKVVSMPALTLTGNGASRLYTPTWSVTTVGSPLSVTIAEPPATPGDVYINKWYSTSVSITGGVPGQGYTVSTVGFPTPRPGQVGNDGSTWGESTSITMDNFGKATLYYRLFSSNFSLGTITMPAMLLKYNSTGESKQFTTGWTVTTLTNTKGGTGPSLSAWPSQGNATPRVVYTSGEILFKGGLALTTYSLVVRPSFPSVQSWKPQLEDTDNWVEINTGPGWGREAVGNTDGTGQLKFQVRIRALAGSGVISAWVYVFSPTGNHISNTVYSVVTPQ
jgi:hypothetical protein